MGHGTPLDTQGQDGCGQSGPFMLEAAFHRRWRLRAPGALRRARQAMHQQLRTAAGDSSQDTLRNPCPRWRSRHRHCWLPNPPAGRTGREASVQGIGKVIEDALRAAGLMK